MDNSIYKSKNMKILIIAAHPDDEVLGCGATIAKFINKNYYGKTIILGEGLTSRKKVEKQELNHLKQNCIDANKHIGITNISFFDLPDNRFDSLPLHQIIRLVESEIMEYRPDIIFTHFGNDLNLDHRITFQAVLTACRPQPDFFNPTIYSFFIPSSTDWIDANSFQNFIPNIFVDVSNCIGKKLSALNCYSSEMKKYPHSRSIESVRIFSQYWGNRVGIKYCEPFILVRKILSNDDSI